MNHLKKAHKVNEIQSPLGNFPESNPARVLFNTESLASTQGNSSGQINSPKVTSEGRYIYDQCEEDFDSHAILTGHKEDTHTNQLDVENEVLEEAKEDQDLYDEIDKITENLSNQNVEKEMIDDIKEKMSRFKTILEKIR